MHHRPSKVFQLEDLRRFPTVFHGTLVATNGCFDVLHVGHLDYLEQARRFGDHLVVGVNDDEAVRALKGPTRPVYSAEDRARLLAALEVVSAVIVFHSVRATEFLKSLRPSVYVKGGDYTLDSLNPEERTALEEMKVDIRFVPLTEGRSTTNTLKRLHA